MAEIREGLRRPTMVEGANPSQPERVETIADLLDRTRRNRLVDAEIRRLEREADPQPASSTPNLSDPPLKLNLDLGGIVTQSLQTAQTMSDKMTTLMNDQTRGDIAALHGRLEEALKLLQQPASSRSPLEVYRDVKAMLDEAAKQMQGQLGLAVAPQSASELPLLLQMKKLDLDMQERRLEFDREQKEGDRRYAEAREERLRRWEVEDRRWTEEFGLKKQEYADSRHRKDTAMENFGDLVNSVAGGIDKEMGDGAAAAPGAPAVKTVRLDGYQCAACSKPLQWDGKPEHEAVCSNQECGARYHMDPIT